MNSQTKLTSIASSLWRQYHDGKKFQVRQLPKGYKNTSFLVEDDRKDSYVLKIYAQGFLDQESIEERAIIVKQLESSGLPVLEMVPGLDGKLCQCIKIASGESYFSTASKYIDIPFSESDINLSSITEIATGLKSLHKGFSKIKKTKTIKKLKVLEILDELTSSQSLLRINEYFLTDSKRIERENAVQNYCIRKGQELSDYFKSRKSLFRESQLCHGDFNLGNFLLRDGRIEKIFDFDEMVLAPKEYEVAITIYHLDYSQETYLDRLIELFILAYYEDEYLDIQTVEDIIMFMQFRAFYRLVRYFTYYQFTDKPGGHFTKFQSIINRLEELDAQRLLEYIRQT